MASSNVESTSITSDELDKEWEKYKIEFGKNYIDKAEDSRRKQNFKNTRDQIKAHNDLYEKGLTTYTMGINQFADKDPAEPVCGCQHRSDQLHKH